jgi:hypothetical protein
MVVIDFRYHSLKPLKELIIVSERRQGRTYYGLLSANNKVYLPLAYNNISYFDNDLFIFTDPLNKKGIIHKNGMILIDASLDSISVLNQQKSLVHQSGRVGMIDNQGNVIHKPIYKTINSDGQTFSFPSHDVYDRQQNLVRTITCDSATILSDELLGVYRNGFTEIIDYKYNVIYRSSGLKELSAFRKNTVYKKSNKYHLIKSSGEEIEEKTGFDTLIFDSRYIYGQLGEKWKIYNRFGSDLSKRKFDTIVSNSNNLIPIKQKGYWGYLDHAGKIAIPAKYDIAGPFIEKIARVNYLGFEYIINQFGAPINDQNFDSIRIEKNNMAFVWSRSRLDMIDNTGKEYFQTFNRLTPHPFGFKESTEGSKFGVISHFGEVILDPIYDSISAPINGKYMVVRKGNKTGLVNSTGFWVIPMSTLYQDIGPIAHGMIGIKKNGQYGFIDFGKKLLVANRYEGVQSFNEERAAVLLNGKWGFINLKEKLVIQPNFDAVENFYHQLSVVKRKGKYGVIDLEGKEVVKIDFDQIEMTEQGFLLVKKGEKYGLYNDLGEIILQSSYTSILPTEDGNFIVQRRGLMGVINSTGRYSIPLKYISIYQMSNDNYLCKMPSSLKL